MSLGVPENPIEDGLFSSKPQATRMGVTSKKTASKRWS